MLACSFCGSVQSPDWWTAPLLLVPVALAVVGVALLSWALRVAGRARVGGLCLAAALIVPLPLAVFVAGRTDAAIEVVSSSPPPDAPAWRISCVTAFQATASGIVNAEFADACGDATRTERWTAYGLVLLAVGLGGFGTALLVTADRRGSSPENDDSPRPEPGAVDHTGVR